MRRTSGRADRRRGQEQVLPRLQPKADLDAPLRRAVELDGIDRGGNVALMCGQRFFRLMLLIVKASLPSARDPQSGRASEAPDNSNSTKLVRRNPTSLMFRRYCN